METTRRTLLEISAASAMAAAAGLFDPSGSASAAEVSGKIALNDGKIRRVVTAHNADGKSLIANDEVVEFANIWTGTPDRPLGATANAEPAGLSRATGQMRCFVAAIPPSKDPKPTMSNRIGYHRGNGISYCLILDGDLAFMVDTQETVVRAGDVVVERNTLHSWRNEGTAPVSMFIVTVNAV